MVTRRRSKIFCKPNGAQVTLSKAENARAKETSGALWQYVRGAKLGRNGELFWPTSNEPPVVPPSPAPAAP